MDQGVNQLVDGNKQVSQGLTQLNQQLASRLSSENIDKISSVNQANDSLNQATTLLNQILSSSPDTAKIWMSRNLSQEEAKAIVPDNQAAQYLLRQYSYTELVKTSYGW